MLVKRKGRGTFRCEEAMMEGCGVFVDHWGVYEDGEGKMEERVRDGFGFGCKW